MIYNTQKYDRLGSHYCCEKLGMKTKDLYRSLKKQAKSIRLRLGKLVLDRPIQQTTKAFDPSKIRKILFLRYDNKIGDMVINTIMFRAIKQNNPDAFIGIVCGKSNYKIIKNNPHIDKVYFYPNKQKKAIQNLAEEIAGVGYDLLYDFSIELRNYELWFIRQCQAKHNAGYLKKHYRLFDCNISFNSKSEHISELYINALKILNINDCNNQYDIDSLMTFKRSSQSKNFTICLNAYGSGNSNCFSQNRLKNITSTLLKCFPGSDIILIYPPNKRQEINNVANEIANNRLSIAPDPELAKTIQTINQSDLLITPDTCFVHIGNALNKPLIAIYPHNSKEKHAWSPNYENAEVILTRPEKYKNEKINIGEFNDNELIILLSSHKSLLSKQSAQAAVLTRTRITTRRRWLC